MNNFKNMARGKDNQKNVSSKCANILVSILSEHLKFIITPRIVPRRVFFYKSSLDVRRFTKKIRNP